MSDADLDAGIPLFNDGRSNAQIAVMAAISDHEFSWAQVVVPDLIRYPDYQDWLDHREGFQIGLSMAGVEVKTISIALVPFLVWCRLVQNRPSERSLDDFALTLFRMREPPEPVAHAVVRQSEFEAHAQAVDAFASHNDFDAWNRHRGIAQRDLAAAGIRSEALPISVEDFVAWSRCLDESTSEASLDRYAALVFEFLTQDLPA